MADPSPVRFGVLGAGRIARERFVPALRRVPGACLQAVASRELARAQALGPRRAYATYEALLDDPEVEAVYVATHNGLHQTLTIGALERGKHVLCEKPLGNDADQCAAMLAAAQRSRRVLVEAFMYRYHPQIAAAQDLVRQGAIGELRTVEAAFSFPLTKADDVRWSAAWGGGGLLDVGCYCVNVCRLFLGNRPRGVQAAFAFHPLHGVDVAVHGVLDHGEGRFGIVSCGFDAGLRNRVLLSGTAGTIELPRAFLSWQLPPVLVLERDGKVEQRAFAPVDVFELEIEDFVAAVRTGRAPLLAPDEGLHNARILDALRLAARAGTR